MSDDRAHPEKINAVRRTPPGNATRSEAIGGILFGPGPFEIHFGSPGCLGLDFLSGLNFDSRKKVGGVYG